MGPMSDDAVSNQQLLSPHLCQAMPLIVLRLEKSLANLPLHISLKTDVVWGHVTECNAAEPFHAFHMGPMSDDAVSNQQLLSPHLCQAMLLFVLRLAKSLASFLPTSWKTDAVWRHVTECNAAEPFHAFHMGPMSDDAVSNQLLNPHLCYYSFPAVGCGVLLGYLQFTVAVNIAPENTKNQLGVLSTTSGSL
jgi:hypothetical protein